MRPRVAIAIPFALLLGVALYARFACTAAPPAEDGGADAEAASSPAREKPADALVEPGSRDEGEGRERASRRGEERLRVRSSAGIDLAEVEVVAADGSSAWQALEGGELALRPGASPRALRAAGHLDLALAPLAREVVLEPDALLELACADIASVIAEVLPFPSHVGRGPPAPDPRRGRSLAFGRASADRIAIAVTSDRAQLPDEGVAPIRLTWADGRRAQVEMRPTPGLRARWDLPREAGPPAAPLALEVVHPSGAEVRRATVVIERSEREAEIDRRPDLEFPWGSVAFDAAIDGFRRRLVDLARGRLEIEHLPTGLDYRLTVVDEASGAFGALAFVHDGSERVLALEPPYEVVLRVIVPDGEPSPSEAQVGWQRCPTEAFCRGWESRESPHVRARADGSFRIPGPDRWPGTDVDAAPPPWLHAFARAPGFRPWQAWTHVGSARVVELVAQLEPLPGDLVLAPGHGLATDAPPRSGAFATSLAPPWYDCAIEGAREREDGSLVLSLQRDDGRGPIRYDVQGLPSAAGVPPIDTDEIERCVLDGGRAFVRGDDGRFAPVDVRRHAVTVDVRADAPEGGPWTVGWQWGGISWHPRETVRLRPGVVEVELVAPVGARLWWGPSFVPHPDPAPGTGGFRPLLRERERLVIP